MNYIFLDVDGVLNTHDFIKQHLYDDVWVDIELVNNLAKVVKETNAKVILSSSWRYGYDQYMRPLYKTSGCAELLRILKEAGIVIRGSTQRCIREDYDKGQREEHIQTYIDRHFQPGDNFVIFDDEDWNFGHSPGMSIFKEHFIQTDWRTRGLDQSCINKALNILLKKENQ